jgi:NAD(P)-dependent dehydrogenase (short-subunit alcohol dehydrogenase family)
MTDRDTSTRRTWFITGTSSGVGHELALTALRRGDRVAATARNTGPLADLVSSFPDQVLAVELDVRDEKAVQLAVKRTMEAFGRIDVVVNNAGYGLFGAVEETTDEQARAIFDTNVFGVLNVLRAALPVLRQQRAGHIVQMSSLFGHMSFPGTGVLAATKHAVAGLTEALAIELNSLGIRCTLIEPAGLNTSFMSKAVFAGAIPDYDEITGSMLRSLEEVPLESLPSASAVATLILKAVSATNPPLLLALGRSAEDEIRKTLTARLSDLDDWADTTREPDASMLTSSGRRP